MKASTSHTDWNGMWLSFFLATLVRVPGADLSYRRAMGQCTCVLPMSRPHIAQLACTSEVHHRSSASGLTHAGKSPSISDEANRRRVWDGWKPHLCYGSKAPARLSSMTAGLHRHDNTHRRDLNLSPFKPHLPTRRNHRPSWFRHIFHFPSGVVEEVFFGSLSLRLIPDLLILSCSILSGVVSDHHFCLPSSLATGFSPFCAQLVRATWSPTPISYHFSALLNSVVG